MPPPGWRGTSGRALIPYGAAGTRNGSHREANLTSRAAADERGASRGRVASDPATSRASPMTRFVLDAGAVLHLAGMAFDVSPAHELLAPTLLRSQTLSALHEAVHRGELPAAVARERLAR